MAFAVDLLVVPDPGLLASTTATSTPRRASSRAVVSPTMPAPTTRTS
ncbi:MAG: hypothetical protein V9G10_10625 [Candidatus Nanopelagicales bacterium]